MATLIASRGLGRVGTAKMLVPSSGIGNYTAVVVPPEGDPACLDLDVDFDEIVLRTRDSATVLLDITDRQLALSIRERLGCMEVSSARTRLRNTSASVTLAVQEEAP